MTESSEDEVPRCAFCGLPIELRRCAILTLDEEAVFLHIPCLWIAQEKIAKEGTPFLNENLYKVSH